MAKKAYLVDFSLRTRVVAEEDTSDEQIAELAAERIMGFMHEEGAEAYLNSSNVDVRRGLTSVLS